jgi:predicted permease
METGGLGNGEVRGVVKFWERWRKARRFDDDWRAEMEHHLAMKEASLIAGGLGAEEARRRARVAFGAGAQWRDDVRGHWAPLALEALARDLRYGFRVLWRDRGFALVALLTIGLGIGANAAIFALLNGLLWRALPVHAPERLVRLRVTNLPKTDRQWRGGKEVKPEERLQVPYATYLSLSKQEDSFEGLFGMAGHGGMAVEVNGEGRKLKSCTVTGTYFPVLGVRAAAGRLLDARDDRVGEPQGGWGVVLSHAAARSFFGSAEAAVGKAILVERVGMRVVGVAEKDFVGIHPGFAAAMWIPVSAFETMFPKWKWRTDSSHWMMQVFGRLREGRSREDAAARLRGISPAFMEEILPADTRGEDAVQHRAMKLDLVEARSGYSWFTLQYGPALWTMLAAVIAVLLIAVANLTNLALARGTARREEIAVRLALGASRGRVLGQLLIEHGIVASAGLLLGLALAVAIRAALLQSMGSGGDAIPLDAPLDWRVLGFLAALFCFTVALCGFAPAWMALRSYAREGAPKREFRAMSALRALLLAGQIALTFALLGGAALMTVSLRELLGEKTGFTKAETLFLQPDFFNAGMRREDGRKVYARVLDGARAIPGVEGAAWSMQAPLGPSLQAFTVDFRGVAPGSAKERMVYAHLVSDGYFAAMETPLVAGREFRGAGAEGAPEAILSENLARRNFGTAEAAIGRELRRERGEWIRIVGVARDVKYTNIREAEPPTLYLNTWDQDGLLGLNLVMRGRVDGRRVMALFEKEVGKKPFLTESSLAGNLLESVKRERLLTALLAAFAAFAVFISGIGVLGLFSYSVALRRREIAIRMALGAGLGAIAGHFAQRGAALALAGLSGGALLCLWGRQALDAYLYKVSAGNPWIWAAAAGTLLALAAAASWWPARRAALQAPMTVLKSG